MAAFSIYIDITSGGTYAMDVTNGETSSKVATDLNGKFANIQELLQNGLPEVWTGDSLPDSLPNGKLINYNNTLYYGVNKTQIATDNQISSLQTQINNRIVFFNGAVTYNQVANTTITLYTPPSGCKALYFCAFLSGRGIVNSSTGQNTGVIIKNTEFYIYQDTSNAMNTGIGSNYYASIPFYFINSIQFLLQSPYTDSHAIGIKGAKFSNSISPFQMLVYTQPNYTTSVDITCQYAGYYMI